MVAVVNACVDMAEWQREERAVQNGNQYMMHRSTTYGGMSGNATRPMALKMISSIKNQVIGVDLCGIDL